jgi:hypothetical protein
VEDGFCAERAYILIENILKSFWHCLTTVEKRAMLRSKIYAGECNIPAEKSLRVLDELQDATINGCCFEILKSIVSTDPDLIKGMPKEEFWQLSDEEWRKFHSFHVSDTTYDAIPLQTALCAQIGNDPVGQEALRLFFDASLRALKE